MLPKPLPQNTHTHTHKENLTTVPYLDVQIYAKEKKRLKLTLQTKSYVDWTEEAQLSKGPKWI